MLNSFVSSPNVHPPLDPDTIELGDLLTPVNECTSTCMPECPNTILKMPADKYITKELKLKLDRCHSVADIKGHTASLLGGDQIPTT